jgi:ABC-2 type transport system ATP-binding protein
MERQAIEIKGLVKTYAATVRQGPKHALKGVDLSIPAGSIFGLLGPNGAGKSTMINILAGLVKKTSGAVTIWGFDQDANPRQSRAAIGVMPQELNMDPFFSRRGSTVCPHRSAGPMRFWPSWGSLSRQMPMPATFREA